MKKNRIESVIIYALGGLMFFIGLYFSLVSFDFGDIFYNVYLFFTPLLRYVFIGVGVIILIFQAITSKDFKSLYIKLVVKKEDPSLFLTIVIGFILVLVLPLFSPFGAFLLVYISLLIFCIVYLAVRTHILYLTTVALILIDFLDKILFTMNVDIGNAPFIIAVSLVMVMIILVVINGVINIMKKRDYAPYLAYIVSNLLIVATLYFVLQIFEFRSSGIQMNENYFFWALLIFLTPSIIVLYAGNNNEIKFFK